jgi:hypothetical protein
VLTTSPSLSTGADPWLYRRGRELSPRDWRDSNSRRRTGRTQSPETLGITRLSKSQVSTTAAELDAQVADLRTRPLDQGP